MILNFDPKAIKIGDFETRGTLKIASLTHQGASLKFALGPPGTLPAVVPFEPSNYNGKPEDERVSVVFNLSRNDKRRFEQIEEAIIDVLSDKEPHFLRTTWHWTSKETMAGTPFIKAKINVGGPKAARIFDERCREIQLPKPFKRCEANAVVSIRGIYKQGASYGMLVEVLQMQIQPVPEPCPFTTIFPEEENELRTVDPAKA